MKTAPWAFALAAVIALAGPSLAVDPPQGDVSFWMKKKLAYSEQILAGLANEDFAAISKTARSMSALSAMEKWARGSVPEYQAQLTNFQSATQQLVRASDRENLDGAALAYVQLTLSCVQCHKVVRETLRSQPAKTK